MPYLRLIGYHLHIRKDDKWLDPLIFADTFYLPISKKRCKVSLKNIRKYCLELMQLDKQIQEIEIDKITAVGRVLRKGK